MVNTARNAGIVPEQVDQAYTQSITRADFCALAAAVYRTWEKSGNVKSVDKATVSSRILRTRTCCSVRL
ncbi:MAG: hypothetical protein ACLSDM_04905 [Butyricicoccus sp.]